MPKIINEILFSGFRTSFINGHEISLPTLNNQQIADLVVDNSGDTIIKYVNYSLQISKRFKFPFYTATNIDGSQFKKVPRKDGWRKDPRIASDFQWGNELYTAENSNFDRGHMTKREDVQWGDTIAKALYAADSTFYYTNSVPQHKRLNRIIWRSLEDYILHSETKNNGLKICVFTGPVLSLDNPFFITPVNGNSVQLPILFWKIVIFQKEDGKIYRAGFMMSQNKLLEEDHVLMGLESESEMFTEFKDADTYQVNISLIEELSAIKFPQAIDVYNDDRKLQLVLNEVDIDPDLEGNDLEIGEYLGFTIRNIIL